MDNNAIRVRNAKEGKSSKGKSFYINYLSGKKITQRQAILSKCYECMGYYADGRRDCLMQDCALYPWMPYRGSEEDVVVDENIPALSQQEPLGSVPSDRTAKKG
jgi:hypothetical protein